MLTCYKPKTIKDPLMSPHYPYVLVKDEYIGQDRLTVLEWKGKNPHIPYNPRHVPSLLGPVFYDWASLSRPGFMTRVGIEWADDPYDYPAYEYPPQPHEPDWPC